MRDLQSRRAIVFKAVLFVVAGLVSCGLLLWQQFTLQTIFLIAVLVWSSCRAYYFAFYVLHHYVDPSFRYDGLASLLRYVWRKR